METHVEHSLSAEKLAVGYDQREIIHDLSVRIPTGKISVIVGANACGKSTLLKTLARLLKPSRGSHRPRRRGSPSPTWSAAAGTRGRAGSGNGPRVTTRRSPTR
jgi:ABC-type transporter Mla maintaining outer membrane lipid asymmetry ATPase subunit MlaF